jgi:hypothetical protein
MAVLNASMKAGHTCREKKAFKKAECSVLSMAPEGSKKSQDLEVIGAIHQSVVNWLGQAKPSQSPPYL